jgi:FAD/FMN-containing dehydrogenase
MASIEILTREGNKRVLSGELLDVFADSLRGTLIRPTDGAYDEARRVWNGMIDRRPALIARCRGTADVIATVNFARDQDLLVSIRAGGHNVSGAAIAEGGLVIDVSEMRSVHVSPEKRTAWVEGGARLGDVDHETAPFGLAAPLGVVSETGVAGLTLHGGAGWLMRKHGLSIDNLAAIEIVTADGQLVRATEDQHPELFWALRGGGGNFGVATAFEFRLHPVGPQVWMNVPLYPLERAQEVMSTCRDFMDRDPEDLAMIGVLWSAPATPEVPADRQGKPAIILLGCYTGPLESAEQVLAPLRRLGEPIADLSSQLSWTKAQQFLDQDYPNGLFYYWKSIYLNRLDEEVIGVLAEYTAKRPSPESSIDVWFIGGAMNRVAPADTAFAQRHATIMIGIEANFHRREDADANIAWARDLHRDLQRFSDGGNYLNFPGFIEEKGDLLRGAYGQNLERLQKVKAQYDPRNLFPGLLNITPQA